MRLSTAQRTDVGRVRTNNEDNLLVDERQGIFVVADGMGGHNAGEVASSTACEILQKEAETLVGLREKYIKSGENSDIKALRRGVESAMHAAGRAIYKTASKNPEQAGMGTTCTMIFLAGRNKAILAHVGDSRLYVLRGDTVHLLSEDHTFVNELVKRGAITKAQAKTHPQSNVLSRAMGPQASVPIDTMIFDIDPGDTFLLCSDGLYNYYPESAELATDLAASEMKVGLDLLIDRALDRGGHDNTTAIMLRFADDAIVEDAMAAEQRIAILKKISIFAHLSYNELVKVVGLTQMQQIPGGEEFITENEIGHELYVVLSGDAEVIKGGNIIATLESGSHLGEMAMIDSAPRSATVRAKSDLNLLVMHRDEFFGLIRTEPIIASKLLWSFVQVLSGRLRQTNDALQGAQQELDSADEFAIFLDDDDE